MLQEGHRYVGHGFPVVVLPRVYDGSSLWWHGALVCDTSKGNLVNFQDAGGQWNKRRLRARRRRAGTFSDSG
jgi:hypothetical protein